MATASPERDVTVPGDPTKIDFRDPAAVIGLTARTLTEGDSGRRYVHIGYPVIEGAPSLNDKVHQEAERQLRSFTKDAPADGVFPKPELNVDWQLPAASGKAIGVRLRTGEFLGANWGNSTHTLWYDGITKEAFGSTGLLEGDLALGDLAGKVRQRLAARGPELDRREIRPDAEMFDSMAFNRAGDLVVEFDDCQVGACSLGRVAVAVPAGEAEPLLSAAGRRIQEAARTQAPEPMPASPSVTPTRSPEARSNQAGSVDCRQAKCVALTFDDGPGPYTDRLLDSLRDAGARATFFTVGSNAAAQPDLLRRMTGEGHLVGNHSWAHRDLSKLSTSKIADSLVRTQDEVTAAVGQMPTLVRPPYGAVSKDVATVARQLGVSLVNWDVDTMDWRDGDAKVVADRAVQGAHRGAIILMHDIQRTSVDAVPDILKRLHGKGYTFVTVPELYGNAGMQAGRLYRSGQEAARKQPLT
ncbi:polysaccharide deacetylase family protein [Nonomuraea sp. NBC_01738]|uniref:polysaccharide deacetylase family protein n=1 Tax=Nonomuraea sp. NBC_01738 TaxID=2976003 RepID=UPI002E14DCF1|nr:polysaccharide deacetylase family protein [Nonomuraea sp. NBC_01738]